MHAVPDAEFVRHLLRDPPTAAPHGGLDGWKTALHELRLTWPDPASCAVIAGLHAPSVAFAFAAGYQCAIARLTGSETGFAALCVSERGGNRPRDMQCRLDASDDGWRLNGEKSYVTGATHADTLYVAASAGADDAGRNRIRLLRVAADAPGVVVRRLPDLAFVPELPHAAVSFTAVHVEEAALLPGDGYERYVKPFRSIEDIHVELALLGHMLRQARATTGSEPLQARLLGQVALLRAIATMPPEDAATHLLLAGNRPVFEDLLAALEAAWQAGNPGFHALWTRDRALLAVAGTARAARTAKAWAQLRPAAAQPPPEGQWPLVAGNWKQLGSPLRPTAEDVGFFARALREWCSAHPGRSPRALILGVTPELYRLPWPEPALVRAADRSVAMIEHIWPGPAANVIRADWRELPLPDASLDVVVCDGGLHLLDYPEGQARLARTLARLIVPGGLFVVRLFVPPPQPEGASEVLAALLAGRVPDLNCLKLRLGMALQRSPATGVALHAVWQLLRQAAGDWPALAAQLGWPLQHLEVIDAYRDSAARYHFVTTGEATALLAAHGFEVQWMASGSYAMAGQCPTVVLRRTQRADGAFA
jgi:alkylation response protein AidB-like acyl-CoA dehydrogenase/SAM-dependent methyltransferase